MPSEDLFMLDPKLFTYGRCVDPGVTVVKVPIFLLLHNNLARWASSIDQRGAGDERPDRVFPKWQIFPAETASTAGGP